jgi:hypothetical protein
VSNNESFIDEVSEEVRRDRLYGALRRYGWIGAVAVVVIVGGAAWFEWQRAQARAAAEVLGDGMLDALAAADPVAALVALPGGGAVEPLRLMLVAASQETAGDADGARATLETVAAMPGIDPLYADLARLKALMLASDMDPGERLAAFGALSEPGAPYRMPALEQMALMQIASNDEAAARGTLAAILEDASLTQGMRARAEALTQALGGSVAADPAAGE